MICVKIFALLTSHNKTVWLEVLSSNVNIRTDLVDKFFALKLKIAEVNIEISKT